MPIVRAGFVRAHSQSFRLALRCSDAALLVSAGWLAYALLGSHTLNDNELNLLSVVSGVAGAFAFEQYGLYQTWRGWRLSREMVRIVAACTSAMGLTVVALALIDMRIVESIALPVVACWFLMGTLGIVTARLAMRSFLRFARAAGYNQRDVLLVGLTHKGVAAVRRLRQEPSVGYRVLGYVDDRSNPRGITTELDRMGGISDVDDLIAEYNVSEVWIGYSMAGEARARELIHKLRDSMVAVRFLLEMNPFDVRHCTMTEMAGVPMLNLHAAPLDDRPSRAVKDVFDRTFAAVALLLLSPLFVAIAVGVRLSSPGPIFYRQERVTWKKQRFTMLKFRSMPVASESVSGPVWSKPGDKRATRFGGFLRRTSLDELPQLINVLRGDMSIVGPRPERPEFVEQFKEQVPWYMKKHMVKAGITGWAQVHGWRGETDLERRIEHDLFYIQHWSIWLDFQIILRTFIFGFVNKNAY